MLTLLALPALLPPNQLQVDPLLLVQATEVWSVVGRKENPLWPGWDARKTPILIYFPGKQDVLINHPNPPEGFQKYTGAIRSSIGPIYIRDGSTLKETDGQNTSAEVGGVGTLVVADTLSTRRQWATSLAGRYFGNPLDASKAVTDSLWPNPYSSMALFAHEAFHVYQMKIARKKVANELDVLRYPSLGIENNMGFALESDFLAQAAKANSATEARSVAVKFLAVRKWRRATIPESSTRYEDGNEFSEGLAKYVEYKLMECLTGRTPSKEMWLVQGFKGYADLEPQRKGMIEQMQRMMSGEALVNNDLYGASPVRFRLYFSGLGIAAMLDKLGAKWHDQALKTDASLTSLVEATVKPTPEELEQAKAEALASPRFKELTGIKTKLAQDGQAHIQEVLASFESCPGVLEIDYSKLSQAEANFTFTPFGILRIDDDTSILRLIPIRGTVGGLSFSEEAPYPVLHDQKAKKIRYQLSNTPNEADIKKQLEPGVTKTLNLPGVALKNVKGSVAITGRKVTLTLAE